jgi:hypothetical protein
MLSQARSGDSRDQHVQWRKVSTHVSVTVIKPAASDNCCAAVDSIWRTQVSTDSRFLHMKPKFDNTLKNSLHVSAPPKMHYTLNKRWTLIKRQLNPVPYILSQVTPPTITKRPPHHRLWRDEKWRVSWQPFPQAWMWRFNASDRRTHSSSAIYSF